MISDKEKNFVSAVIYVHNIGKHIQYFLKKICGVLSDNFDHYEIICVNDASTDDSVEKIRDFAASENKAVVSILNMSFYQGRELSMNAGIDLAIGDFIYQFDSVYIDYPTKLVMDIYRRALEGFDIVSASTGGGSLRTKCFYLLFNACSDSSYKLCSETFRIISRRAVNRSTAMSRTVPYRKAIYANCGLKMDVIRYAAVRDNEMKFTHHQKINEKGRHGDSLILFTDVAYKIAMTLTILMMLATIFAGGYTLYIFIKQQPIAGWTTTMLLLSIGFFGVFAVFTIIIKYLSILVNLVFKRQTYVQESIEKLTKQ